MLKYQFASFGEFVSLRQPIKEYFETICKSEPELLFVALNEAVNNAFFHGLKTDRSANVEVTIAKCNDEVLITVKHNGDGYKSYKTEALDQDDSLNEHGRGLAIIGLCTDSYRFNSSGNELEMRKKV